MLALRDSAGLQSSIILLMLGIYLIIERCITASLRIGFIPIGNVVFFPFSVLYKLRHPYLLVVAQQPLIVFSLISEILELIALVVEPESVVTRTRLSRTWLDSIKENPK